MSVPEAVVFDLGKVLLDFDYSVAVRKLMVRTRREAMAITDFLLHTPVIVQYETGLISDQEFYKAVCEGTGYSGTPEEFAASFGDIFSPIQEMIAWHERLRSQGVPTFLFSNTNGLAISFIRETFPFFRNFDGYILSYEHRSMKPEPRIYEVVEETTGRRGNQLLYIDDRAENISAGASRGWQTILHESPARSIEHAQQLGL
jgi:FMN phosphatase YigB (HAD superfamily)